MTTWNNRIIKTAEVDPRALLAHPDNWRIHPEHQQRVMTGVLGDVGWIQHIVVSESTGRIIDGHLRVMLAKAGGQAAVPVAYVALSEAEEAKALASFDSVAGLSELDGQALMRALDGFTTEDQALTGFFDDIARDAEAALMAGLDDTTEAAPATPRVRPRQENQVRLVLCVPSLALFERAVRATGQVNREKAVEMLCHEYLKTKGQLHAVEQDGLAAQLAEAVQPALRA